MPVTITIPLVNANENEALLAALHVQEGQSVSAGDVLATLETTKSTLELNAEAAGYIIGLRLQAGQTVRAGEILCFLAEQPDWQPPVEESVSVESPAATGAAASIEAAIDPSAPPPPGLRITQPALALARQAGLDLARLPLDRLVTGKAIQALLAAPADAPQATATHAAPAMTDFDPTALLIYGGGGHAKALIELIRLLDSYRIIGVLDDGRAAGEQVLGVPFLGGGEQLASLYAQGVRLAVNAVGGIGSLQSRQRVFERLAAAGFACPPVIHPRAFVEASAVLAAGVQVFPHAYIGSEAVVGFGSIINTGAIVSHDCRLGELVNLSPGAILAGEVQVGDGVLLGMGATVNLRVHIAPGVRAGNGATIKSDIPAGTLIKAGSVWPG